MDSSQRVVSRYLARVAGVFEPPPAMEEAIISWIQDVYAGHLLAQAVPELENLQRVLTLYDELDRIPEEDEEARAPIIEEIRVRRPPMGRSLSLGDPRKRFRQNLVTRALLIKYLRSLGAKPKARKVRVQTNFPLDLSGWRYLQDVPDLEAFWANLRAKGLDSIRVHLAFQRRAIQDASTGTAWLGYWDDKKGLLAVAVSSASLDVDSFKKTLDDMREVLRHELAHMAQTVLMVGKGLREDAGLPGREIRDPEANPEGKRLRDRTWSPHEYRDAEFYTNLLSQIAEFKRDHSPTDPGLMGKAQKWVRSRYYDMVRTDPRRAGKAMAEFLKSIEEWSSVAPI